MSDLTIIGIPYGVDQRREQAPWNLIFDSTGAIKADIGEIIEITDSSQKTEVVDVGAARINPE